MKNNKISTQRGGDEKTMESYVDKWFCASQKNDLIKKSDCKLCLKERREKFVVRRWNAVKYFKK